MLSPKKFKNKAETQKIAGMAAGVGALLPTAVALGRAENGCFHCHSAYWGQASLLRARNCIPARAARFLMPFHWCNLTYFGSFPSAYILWSPNINYWLVYPTASALLLDVLPLQFLHFHVWEIYFSLVGSNVSPCACVHTLTHPLVCVLVNMPSTQKQPVRKSGIFWVNSSVSFLGKLQLTGMVLKLMLTS